MWRGTRQAVRVAWVFGLGLVCGPALADTAAPPPPSAPGACHVVVPTVLHGPVWFGTRGNARLATWVPADGQLLVSRSKPGTGEINPDGSIYEKFMWAGAPSLSGLRLRVSGIRVDAHVAPLHAFVDQTNAGVKSWRRSRIHPFWPSALTFASPGCWKVTGEAGGARLTFVIAVGVVS